SSPVPLGTTECRECDGQPLACFHCRQNCDPKLYELSTREIRHRPVSYHTACRKVNIAAPQSGNPVSGGSWRRKHFATVSTNSTNFLGSKTVYVVVQRQELHRAAEPLRVPGSTDPGRLCQFR